MIKKPLTPTQQRNYQQWVEAWQEAKDAGAAVIPMMTPSQYVRATQTLRERRAEIKARGGRDYRSLKAEMEEHITIVSERSAYTTASHALDYVRGLKKEERAKLIAKNPEWKEWARMGKKELAAKLMYEGPDARKAIYDSLPSKKVRRQNRKPGQSAYVYKPVWYDSP